MQAVSLLLPGHTAGSCAPVLVGEGQHAMGLHPAAFGETVIPAQGQHVSSWAGRNMGLAFWVQPGPILPLQRLPHQTFIWHDVRTAADANYHNVLVAHRGAD